MDSETSQLGLLAELDAQHDELLRRIDELDKLVEKALADCQMYRTGKSSPELACAQ
jgi:hypothetical protein